MSGLLRMGAQTALRVGASDDPLEREADAVAEHVVASSAQASTPPEKPASRSFGRPAWSVMPRSISRASSNTGGADRVDSETENKINSMRGGGRPLTKQERATHEPPTGQDFSRVRVHEGTSADQAADSLGAKGFTLGNDVFLASGQYTAGTEAGTRFMAHELAHVVQQTGSAGPARLTPRDDAKTIRRQPKFKSERARQKAINAAIWWNRRRHSYSDGLALELFKIARTNTPFRRIRKTRKIDSNFVWLVGDTQKKLGLPVTGRLDQRTIRIALNRTGASVGTFAKIMIGIARKLVRNIPNWIFGPVPFLGILFKSAVNRLLDRLIRLSASKIGRMIVNTVKAVTSWKFIKAFIKGIYEGFVKDGFIGTLQGIWEVAKLPVTVWTFANNVLKKLNDFSILGALRGIFNQMARTAAWVRKNGRQIWNNIGRAANNARSTSVGSIFGALVRGSKTVGNKIGNSIATMLIKFFGSGAANIAAGLGGAAGRFAGNAGWVALLGVLTAGAGAAVAKAAQFLAPILRMLATPARRVLSVVRKLWSKLSGFLTTATKGFGNWIAKISPTLSQKFLSIFAKVRSLFERLIGRVNRRRAPRRKPAGKGKGKDKDKGSGVLKQIAVTAARQGWSAAKKATRSEIKSQAEIKGLLNRTRVSKPRNVKVDWDISISGKSWKVKATARKGTKRASSSSGNGWIMRDRGKRPFFANRSQEKFHDELINDAAADVRRLSIADTRKGKPDRSLKERYDAFLRIIQKVQRDFQNKLSRNLKGIAYKVLAEPFSKVQKDRNVATDFIVEPNVKQKQVRYDLDGEERHIVARLFKLANRVRLHVQATEGRLLDGTGNVAVASLAIKGLKVRQIWPEVSGGPETRDKKNLDVAIVKERQERFIKEQARTGNTELPTDSEVTNFEDAERKILEAIVEALKKAKVPKDAKGVILIYTERKMCTGCVATLEGLPGNAAFRSFAKEFPRIKPKVYFTVKKGPVDI